METTPTAPEQPINSMETQAYKEMLVEEAESKLRNVKIILFVLGGLQIAIGIFYYIQFEEAMLTAIIIQFIIGSIYLALGFLVNKHPLIAVSSGLAIYGGLTITNVIIDPSTILTGLLLKIFIIVAFVKAIGYAKEVLSLRKKIAVAGNNPDGLPLDLVD